MDFESDQHALLLALYELSQGINSAPAVSDVMSVAAAQLAKTVAPDVIFLYLVRGGKLRLVESRQGTGNKRVVSPEVTDVGVCLCGLAASGKRPVYSRDIHRDPRCTLPECKLAGIQSFAALPLIDKAEIIGVLSLASFSDRDFQKESAFLEIAAGAISLALANARVCENLKKSETLYRLLFEASPLPLWVYDTGSLAFLAVNDAAVNHYGYSRDEFLSMTINDIRPGEDVPELRQTVLRRSFGLFRSGVWRHRTKDGALIDVDITAHDILFQDKPARLTIAHDVTESRRAQDLLRQSEERYRNVVDRAHDGIIIIQDGSIKFANARMAELDGSSLEELIGTPYVDHIHPSELPRLREFYRRRMAGEALPSIYETILLRKDGRAAPSELSAGVVMYEGKPADMVIIRDITERKKAEEALKESELRLSSLMQTASDAVILSDVSGAILTWNVGAKKIFGYEEHEVLGKPLTILMPERHRNDHLKGLERLSASRTSQYPGRIMDFRGIRKDGSEFPLELSVTSRYTQKGVLFLGIIRDVTEHRKLEEQLRQAQKMEAIGLLAGGVAHDFNNILSAIIGYCHLSLMKLPEHEPVKLYIEEILQSSERATTLTQRLLAFSRKQLVKKELVKLNSVIGNFEKFLARLLREDMNMKTRFCGDELMIMADRGQIEQVIMNLVTNARDAMSANGTVKIETSRVTVDASFVAAHGYGLPGAYAVISVSDTGFGMDEETRQKIFEPFFTTKEQGKGTGLGLATVYGIVKTHDGFINVYSEPGNGTVVTVYLPLAHSMEKAPEHVSQAPAPFKGGAETILLAEDDESLRKMTSIVLRHVGYSVIEAENGLEAVRRFSENRDAIRLVILDGIMPVMNGKEAHQEISALVPGVRCIYMSGYAEDVFTKDGILQTEVTFLPKPVTPSALLNKVREALDQ